MLETELQVTRRAIELVREVGGPKGRFEAIKIMAGEGIPIEVACRVVDVSVSGYYAWLSRPPSARLIRHTWLTDLITLITEVHQASRGVYGSRRVHAELRLGQGMVVGYGAVEVLMRRAGLVGVMGRPKWRRAKPDRRVFTRSWSRRL